MLFHREPRPTGPIRRYLHACHQKRRVAAIGADPRLARDIGLDPLPEPIEPGVT